MLRFAIGDNRFLAGAVRDGATVPLAAGPHILQTTTPGPNLRLLWGRNTQISPEAPSAVPLYTGSADGTSRTPGVSCGKS